MKWVCAPTAAVDFSDRLLAISTNPGGIAGGGITGGAAVLVNVGDVTTDGIDAAFTWRFGRVFSIYNALSYNLSKYKNDYTATAFGIGAATNTCLGGFLVSSVPINGVATNVVPTCGKQLPGTAKWMNKTVATLTLGAFEAQLTGDYVGRRFATFTNDTSVDAYFLTSARLAYALPSEWTGVRKAELSLNVTNLGDIQGASSLSIGSATNGYSAYPIARRQFFVTFAAGF